MKAKINKETLNHLYSLSSEIRRDFFKPRKETLENAAIRFLLFCIYYFPETFYNAPSPSHLKAAEFIEQARTSDINEFMWVATGGVGKSTLLTAYVARQIIYNLDNLTVYQSAVEKNTSTFITKIITMVISEEIIHDYGLIVNQSLVGKGLAEKRRMQRQQDFTFTNGCRIVSSNLFSTVRGLVHSDIGIQTSKINTIILDDISTSQSSLSARLKERVGEAVIEARRSLDKANSRCFLLGNITKGENYCQETLKERKMQYLVTPLTNPVRYYDGVKENIIEEKSITGTNLSDVELTKESALAFNKDKDEYKHHSWVQREYDFASPNERFECECEFFENSNLIFGKYAGKDEKGGSVNVRGITVNLYPFNVSETLYIGIDMGGGRNRDPSVCVGLSESGKVGLVLESKTTPPDVFAEIVKEVIDKYIQHYLIVIERDVGAGAECIRCIRKLVGDSSMFRERHYDRANNKPSMTLGWTPTSAKIEAVTDNLSREYNSLQLNHIGLIQQMQTMTWEHLRERDTSLDHHFDLVRALSLSVYARKTTNLMKK